MKIKELKIKYAQYMVYPNQKTIDIQDAEISATKKFWQKVVKSCKKIELEMLIQVVNDLKPDEKEEERKKQAVEILEFLREVTICTHYPKGKNFVPWQNGKITANMKIVINRLKDGWTTIQLKRIILSRCQKWLYNNKMREFIRPSTIFMGAKIHGYYEEAGG